jgi:hypothetical protein
MPIPERVRKAGRARHQPDVYIRSLARMELTDAQRRKLAELLMPFLAGDGNGEAGDAA